MIMKMRTILKASICIFLLLVCSLSGYAQDNKLSGTWNYKAPNAPYGYDTGTIKFKQVEGKLVAEMNINGSVINVDKIEKKGDAFVCNLSVDYNSVKVSFKPGKEKMTAIASLDDGTELNVEMTQQKD